MKELVTTKDGQWTWPVSDDRSYNNQKQHIDLVNHLLPHLKNKNIMVQAGGNCGLILSTFVDHFKTIYTFEPDPVNFYCLVQNVHSPTVYKMQACLGNETKTLEMQHLDRVPGMRDIGGVHVTGTGNVPQVTIDSLNLLGCDLIQLDVEGYELKALQGAINTIKKYKPVICVEIYDLWLERYDAKRSDIATFLTELGYTSVGTQGVDNIFIPN